MNTNIQKAHSSETQAKTHCYHTTKTHCHHTLKDSLKNKREATCHIQGILNAVIGRFLIRRLWVDVFEVLPEKKMSIKNPVSNRAVLQSEGEIKMFSDKQKWREFISAALCTSSAIYTAF